MMHQPTIISFKDADTADDATIIVRQGKGTVVLGLSLRANGDIQVVMNKEEAQRLVAALNATIV